MLKLKYLLIVIVGFLLLSSSNIPQQADISINDIFIIKPFDFSVLGIDSINVKITDKKLPYVQLLNKTGSQLLTLIIFPGNPKNTYSRFRVELNNNTEDNKNIKIKNIEYFKTGKGIKLGITIKKLKELLGREYIEKKNKNKIIVEYLIKDYKKSQFLKYYNFPEYHSKYIFKNDVLICFEYGFTYP